MPESSKALTSGGIYYYIYLIIFFDLTAFLGIKNFSSINSITFASNLGYFFVNSLNLISIDLQSFLIKISNSLILLTVKEHYQVGASNFFG